MNFQTSSQSDLGKPYLRFQIEPQNQAVFPMKYAQEVLTIPRQGVTSIPNMSSHIIGLVNRRNLIYWLLDLSLMLGLNCSCKGVREYNIVFVKINKVSVGLVVQKIKGITRINSKQIQSPIDSISSQTIPYLDGCIVDDEKLTYVLDPIAILETKLIDQ